MPSGPARETGRDTLAFVAVKRMNPVCAELARATVTVPQFRSPRHSSQPISMNPSSTLRSPVKVLVALNWQRALAERTMPLPASSPSDIGLLKMNFLVCAPYAPSHVWSPQMRTGTLNVHAVSAAAEFVCESPPQ